MPSKVIVDSSVLIPFLRSGTYGSLIARLANQGRFLLCSVVAMELLEGAIDQRQRRRMRQQFQRFEPRAVASPNHQDWTKAGELMSRYAERWGGIDGRKHQNDVLIVLTARRHETEVLTNDIHDMRIWAKMVDPLSRMVVIRTPEALV